MNNQSLTIPIELIACDRNSMFKTMNDVEQGKLSYSGNNPLEVFFITEGYFNGKYLLQDGYHRLFIELLKGKKEVEIYIANSGSYSACDYAVYNLLEITPSSKYNGLHQGCNTLMLLFGSFFN